MASAATKTYLTPRQYLEIERESDTKHEYHDGEIFAMAGASRKHNLIASNCVRVLGNQLLDRPCEVYGADMRVRVEAGGPYTYPDVVVVSGEPRFEDGEVDTLLNPTSLIEILSPSTQAGDLERKSRQYLAMPELRDYVMIAQDEVRVVHVRPGESDRPPAELRNLDDVLALESIGCLLRLRDIYAKVKLADGPGEPV